MPRFSVQNRSTNSSWWNSEGWTQLYQRNHLKQGFLVESKETVTFAVVPLWFSRCSALKKIHVGGCQCPEPLELLILLERSDPSDPSVSERRQLHWALRRDWCLTLHQIGIGSRSCCRWLFLLRCTNEKFYEEAGVQQRIIRIQLTWGPLICSTPSGTESVLPRVV